MTKENRGYVQLTLGTVKKSEVATLGTKIHNYLAGNPLYVECDIILNIDNINKVYIWFDVDVISEEDILKYTKDILDIYSLYIKEILNDKILKEEEEIKNGK